MNYATTAVGSGGGDTATATAIGWGYRNTRAIVAQGNTDTATSGAALADSYTATVSGVTYDDWYLPSKDELNELFLQRSNVGGFAADYYWSSSEPVAVNAWVQDFFDGTQINYRKFYSIYVRPVRAF